MACRLLAHSWMCNGRMCDVGCEMSMMWHVRTVVCCASPNPSGVAPLEPRPRASMIDRRYDKLSVFFSFHTSMNVYTLKKSMISYGMKNAVS